MKERLASFLQQLSQLAYQDPVELLPRFVVIEGLDGSGTSTQARLLEQDVRNRGLLCHRSTEPSSGSIGKHIRQILQNKAPSRQSQEDDRERRNLAQYFAADRMEHIWGNEGIAQKIQQGYWCISERYLFSSLVYQSLDPAGGNMDLAQVWQLNRKFPLPQHCIYLDIAAKEAKQRILYREQTQKLACEVFEQEDFLDQIGQAYLALLEHFRQIDCGMQIHQLPAMQEKVELQRQIQQIFPPTIF